MPGSICIVFVCVKEQQLQKVQDLVPTLLLSHPAVTDLAAGLTLSIINVSIYGWDFLFPFASKCPHSWKASRKEKLWVYIKRNQLCIFIPYI